MSVQVENLEKNTAKLTIEVPAEKFEEAVQHSYNMNKGKLQKIQKIRDILAANTCILSPRLPVHTIPGTPRSHNAPAPQR